MAEFVFDDWVQQHRLSHEAINVLKQQRITEPQTLRLLAQNEAYIRELGLCVGDKLHLQAALQNLNVTPHRAPERRVPDPPCAGRGRVPEGRDGREARKHVPLPRPPDSPTPPALSSGGPIPPTRSPGEPNPARRPEGPEHPVRRPEGPEHPVRRPEGPEHPVRRPEGPEHPVRRPEDSAPPSSPAPPPPTSPRVPLTPSGPRPRLPSPPIPPLSPTSPQGPPLSPTSPSGPPLSPSGPRPRLPSPPVPSLSPSGPLPTSAMRELPPLPPKQAPRDPQQRRGSDNKPPNYYNLLLTTQPSQDDLVFIPQRGDAALQGQGQAHRQTSPGVGTGASGWPPRTPGTPRTPNSPGTPGTPGGPRWNEWRAPSIDEDDYDDDGYLPPEEWDPDYIKMNNPQDRGPLPPPPPVTRKDCEEIMRRRGEESSYMVRRGSSMKRDYTLSLLHEDNILHFPIKRHDLSPGSTIYHFGNYDYDDLRSIVKYYSKNPILVSQSGREIRLGRPIHNIPG